MVVKERQRVEERVALPAVTGRREAFIWAAATVVIAALAVVLVVFLMDSGTETVVAPDLRSDQQVLADLASRGYIPAEAVDYERLATENLVNQGLLPEAALRGYIAPSAPIFTPEDLALIHAAQTGVIPMEAVDWDDVALKRLVNQGLIPRAALDN